MHSSIQMRCERVLYSNTHRLNIALIYCWEAKNIEIYILLEKKHYILCLATTANSLHILSLKK